MKSEFKDSIIRVFKTFWPAALASSMVAIPEVINHAGEGWITIKPMLISIGIGALAAGFSELYNGILKKMMISNNENGGKEE